MRLIQRSACQLKSQPLDRISELIKDGHYPGCVESPLMQAGFVLARVLGRVSAKNSARWLLVLSGCDNPRLDGGGGHFGPLGFFAGRYVVRTPDCRGRCQGDRRWRARWAGRIARALP
jgi:hypothetical protein